MSLDMGPRPDPYAVLFVHPTAPTELLAAMYWALAGHLQQRRTEGEHIDDDLHHLTRSYESVADIESRALYDASAGLVMPSLMVRKLPPVRRSIRSRLLRRAVPEPIDLYEVMGVARNVPQELLAPAYRIMRDQYFKLRSGQRQAQLLEALQRAYETLKSPEARQQYDARFAEAQRYSEGPDPFAGPVDPATHVAPAAATVADSQAEKVEITKRNQPDAVAAAVAEAPGATLVASVAEPAPIPTPVAPPAPIAAARVESPAPAIETASLPPGERLSAKALRWSLIVARFIISVIAAILRLAYLGIRAVVRAAYRWWQNRQSKKVARPVRIQPPLAPVTRSSTDQVKIAPSELEDRFLGRVATSVKESESHLHHADPGSGQAP